MFVIIAIKYRLRRAGLKLRQKNRKAALGVPRGNGYNRNALKTSFLPLKLDSAIGDKIPRDSETVVD